MNDNQDQGLIDAFLIFLEMGKGRTVGTVDGYRRHLIRRVDFLSQSGQRLLTASRGDLERFTGLYLHQQGILPRSRKPAIAAVKGFYRWVLAQGLVSEDPAETIFYPSVGRKIPDFISLQHVERLFAQINLDDFKGVRDAALIACLAGCGLRVSGLTGLNQGDLIFGADDVGRQIVFLKVKEKGGHERLVPAPPETLLLIRAYLGHPELADIDRTLSDGDQVLFVNTRNPTVKNFNNCGEHRRLSSRSVRRMIVAYGAKAGIPLKLCHPHALRHLYGTELVESDTDLTTVQQLMGHATLESTKLYIHTATKRLQDAVRKGNPLAKINTPVSGLTHVLDK